MCVNVDGYSKFRGSKTHLVTVSTALPSYFIVFKVIRKIIHRRLAKTLNSVSFNLIDFFDLYFYHSNRITKFY
jgi:hypothetical protein